MSKRALTDKVKDYESLIKSVTDLVPMSAVRKLYKLTKDLSDKLETIEVPLEPSDLSMKSHEQDLNEYSNQIREMSKEIIELKKENQELKSDKWYTPLWN